VRIISFGLTTSALLAGAKTVTRRDWSPRYAEALEEGELLQAWDRSPRTRMGRRIGTIRLTGAPAREWSGDFPASDMHAEGFAWMQQNGQADLVERIVTDWIVDRPRWLYVVRFEVVYPLEGRRS
jgi:hypothetical protein